MTCKDIYRNALAILAESMVPGDNEDFEERAPFLLANFCTELFDRDSAMRHFLGETQGEELIKKCAERNIGFICMKPLAGGAIEDPIVAMRFIASNPDVTVVIPGMADFTFMEGSKAKLFVNAPNALEGNEISKCDSSAAAFQSEEAGLVDVVADGIKRLGTDTKILFYRSSNCIVIPCRKANIQRKMIIT